MKKSKHTLKEWLIAVRPWSFPASAMPVVTTLGYLMWFGCDNGQASCINWAHGIWALANIILFHAAGNTWSDYFDFRKSVDAEDTFGARTLTGGVFTPKEIKRLSLSLLAVAVAGGLVLLAVTGWPLLWIGLGGIACTLLYPYLKYRALGDLVIFITYAILPMLGTSYVAAGTVIYSSLWLAVPVGLITVAILHANNTRDTATDRRAHIRTFAMEIGPLGSRIAYYAEITVPFIWVAACAAAGIFPLWSLVTLAAAIPAWQNIKTMHKAKSEGMAAINSLDEMTAKLQMVFSLLLTLSFILADLL